MRTTVTLEKEAVDELLKKTKARTKASAVREAMSEYLRRRKIEEIRSLKGKLDFDSGTAEARHRER
ncbi:MAG: type II toxin-antitoxin system VapB family antitoxin [Candidatus Aminicenantes bacterium]|nr:type II toxin-antitoxin system VapB family antitoxin [Candidatus Aminicenantes bacterium]